MDRREKLMDAIGEVGSDLIFRAEKERFAPSALRRWGGLAAALVIVAGLTLAALPWLQSGNPQPAAQTQPDVSTTTEVKEEQTDTADAADTAEDFNRRGAARPDRGHGSRPGGAAQLVAGSSQLRRRESLVAQRPEQSAAFQLCEHPGAGVVRRRTPRCWTFPIPCCSAARTCRGSSSSF